MKKMQKKIALGLIVLLVVVAFATIGTASAMNVPQKIQAQTQVTPTFTPAPLFRNVGNVEVLGDYITEPKTTIKIDPLASICGWIIVGSIVALAIWWQKRKSRKRGKLN